MTRISLVLLLISFVFISCRSQDLIRPGDTLEVAYNKAFAQYQNENYSQAADAFETVISIGRGTTIGQDAQYYLAESYFNSERYLMAASEYQRYVQFHPNSERRQEAEFKEALSYYHLSPRYRLDQTYTNQAINGFRLFLSRYPDSERSDQAAEYINELIDKLAMRDYNAAEFYMRTNRYDAAAIYYNQVIDRFPGSSSAERSLVKQIEAYVLYAENSVPSRQEERYEKALDSYNTYLQLFPQGENRSKAEELYDLTIQRLEEIRNLEQVAQN
ncbi:MAG TPA: outer membrane protein assembly factor BamD [Balneolaceae bacterium]|nr:outer membrane protein assembly factor BamD [Balneolaceae bacterium]